MTTYEVTVVFHATSDGTAQDVDEAIRARLSEFYPLDDECIVPDVTSVEVHAAASIASN